MYNLAGESSVGLSFEQPVETLESITLEDFVAAAFAALRLDWRGQVEHDATLLRPTDIAVGLANPVTARDELRWRARHTATHVVRLMVDVRNRYSSSPYSSDDRPCASSIIICSTPPATPLPGGVHRWRREVTSRARAEYAVDPLLETTNGSLIGDNAMLREVVGERVRPHVRRCVERKCHLPNRKRGKPAGACGVRRLYSKAKVGDQVAAG